MDFHERGNVVKPMWKQYENTDSHAFFIVTTETQSSMPVQSQSFLPII